MCVFLSHYQIVLHTWLLLLLRYFSMGPDVERGSHDDAEEIVKAVAQHFHVTDCFSPTLPERPVTC